MIGMPIIKSMRDGDEKMPKLLLIVNPAAGKMRSKTALFTIVDTFCRGGYQVTTYITAARDEARRVAALWAQEHDLVVCCGGDGTLNEVMDALVGHKITVPLGYIPAGSTNDFASSLKLSLQPQKAALAIVNGKESAIDVGVFNRERRFAYIASFGVFTAASYSAPQAAKNMWGHFAYILEGLKELSTIQSYPVRVMTDERAFENDYLFGAVCNSTSVAGLVHLNQGVVDMSDGLFELILVRRPKSVADLSKILQSLNTGKFDGNDMFDFCKTSSVTFSSDSSMPWSLDGEYQAGCQNVTIQNQHNALNFRH